MKQCSGGEYIIVHQHPNSLKVFVLDNQLNCIGVSTGGDILSDFRDHAARMTYVSVDQSKQRELLVVNYSNGMFTTHHQFINRYKLHNKPFNDLYNCCPNRWKSRVFTNIESQLMYSIWVVPEFTCDLFLLPKFRYLIIHYCAALRSMLLLPELRISILRLAFELLQPIDYCEQVW